jgi:hypothetical protein
MRDVRPECCFLALHATRPLYHTSIGKARHLPFFYLLCVIFMLPVLFRRVSGSARRTELLVIAFV